MPIYEYWCPQCRSSFEKLRPIQSKDTEVSCPRCNSPVKRMLSVFAAVGRSSDGQTYQTGSGGCVCGGDCGCRN